MATKMLRDNATPLAPTKMKQTRETTTTKRQAH
jgi:hypothetical protein